MSRRYSVDIAVIGGGMVGAACAALLARQGRAVLLLDRRPPTAYVKQPLPDLRVSAVAPGNRQLLDELGAWELIAGQRCTPYAHMEVVTGSGGRISFQAHEHGLRQLGWIVENALVQTALWQSLPDSVQTLTGVRVTALQQRRHGVDIVLDDATGISARLAVAADGAGSAVRSMLDIGTRARPYHQQALVAVLETGRPNPGIAWQIHLAGGPLAMLPLDQGRSSLVWCLPEELATAKRRLPAGQLGAELTLASNTRFGGVTVVSEVAGFPLRLQLAKQYRQGRVVLTGDAAHQVHPMAGQGVNLGWQDVAELAAVLDQYGVRLTGDSADDKALERALEAYARRRISVATLMARGIDNLEWLFRHAQRLAGLGLAAVDRLPPLKEAFIRRACALPAGRV